MQIVSSKIDWSATHQLYEKRVSHTAAISALQAEHAITSSGGNAALHNAVEKSQRYATTTARLEKAIVAQGPQMSRTLSESMSYQHSESRSLKRFSDRPTGIGAVGAPQHRQHLFETQEETKAFIRAEVATAGGERITLDLELMLKGAFKEERQVKGVLIDPLVLNYDAPSATLSSKSFEFDLLADGRLEQLAQLNPGSGYLAYDRNANGIVDDGRELFGVHSGDGFGDLSHYDADQNGWIDGADPIYEKLHLWIKDETGDQLLRLGELGIGAIALGHAQTPFALRSIDEGYLGQIQKTGLFLQEDGSAGTIQQLDLARLGQRMQLSLDGVALDGLSVVPLWIGTPVAPPGQTPSSAPPPQAPPEPSQPSKTKPQSQRGWRGDLVHLEMTQSHTADFIKHQYTSEQSGPPEISVTPKPEGSEGFSPDPDQSAKIRALESRLMRLRASPTADEQTIRALEGELSRERQSAEGEVIRQIVQATALRS